MRIKYQLVIPLLFLMMIPNISLAQIQDFRAVKIVAQAFEKAKKDNETKQSTITSNKIHKIENLNPEGNFESIEKIAIFLVRPNKNGKPTEDLIDIRPPGTAPASNPVDFEKLLDSFFGRFYFLLSPEGETIDNQRCFKIHFWPKEDLPPEKENSDYVLNRIAGVIYIDKKIYAVKKIEASLTKNIKVQRVFFSFSMDKFNFQIVFQEWHGMGLPQKMTVTTRYFYRKIFSVTKRYQTHEFYYEYKNN